MIFILAEFITIVDKKKYCGSLILLRFFALIVEILKQNGATHLVQSAINSIPNDDREVELVLI